MSATLLNAGVEAALDAMSRREDALAALHAASLEELAGDVARRLRAMPLVASAWDGQEPDALVDQLRRQIGDDWSLNAHKRASKLLGAASRQVMKEIGKPLGVRFDLANPLLSRAFESLTSPATFEEGAWESVRSSLQESHDAGHSIPEAARDLRTEAGISSLARGRTIARTELIGMVNAGGLAAARITQSAEFKQWLATNDARTRRTHRAASGQVRPIDDTFTVGGYDLDYPGDFRAPAKERANCRCTQLFTDDPEGFAGEQGRSSLLGPSAAPAPPSVPRFSNADEGREWIARSGLADEVDLPGATTEGVQEVAAALNDTVGRFGVRLNGLDTMTGKGSRRANARYRRRGKETRIEIKRSQLDPQKARATAAKEQDAYATQRSRAIERHSTAANDAARPQQARDFAQARLDEVEAAHRWTVPSASDRPLRSIITHEAGHAVEDGLGIGNAWRDALRTHAVTRTDYFAVSEYAATNVSELFAEAFSVYIDGGILPPRVLAALKEVLDAAI